jgi:hypothetical protein
MPFGVHIEKDPQVNQLVSTVFEQMSKIRDEEQGQTDVVVPNEIKFVSLEDAIKELVTLKNAKS